MAIARALVNRPALLLADEPTGALDTATGEEIGELLRELNRTGQTLVLVTHNPDLAARYASRTVQIVDGRTVRDSGSRGRRGPAGRGRGGAGAAMRAGPVARAVRGGVTRRRVQTFVIGLVLLVSTAASVLALPWWWTPAPRSTTRSPPSAARTWRRSWTRPGPPRPSWPRPAGCPA